MKERAPITSHYERPAYLGELTKDMQQQLADLGWSKETQTDMSLGYAKEIIEDQQVFNKEWYVLMHTWADALQRWDERSTEEFNRVIDVSLRISGETSEETISRMEKYIKDHKSDLSPEALYFLSMSLEVKKKGLKDRNTELN